MKIRDIEKLVKILENSIVSEIEIVDFWGRKTKIKKTGDGPVAVKAVEPSAHEQKVKSEQEDETAGQKFASIRSPIVGTFYRSPSPDAPSYVEVGDIIKPGQVVCIVEAMKLMNEIESDLAGKVVQILVKNEDPVEYNQELMLIEPL
ncbi:MAG: acetyl-CoA carboxylase biotin carboxyl carrier protein [candidate division WOR-3 bacterium]|nr:MAG: acetyl-CoA carboxylase biotin carboxyl carrier protein [candidate division WOR-3 bacterium]